MAKQSTAVAPQKGNANLPAEFLNQVAADAGLGAENATAEDMTVPLIKIAQALSPEVNKREATYIQGLEVGDFFNSATQKVWKGDVGFDAIPVYFERKYLQWTPRDKGGGFGGEHDASIMDKTTAGEKGENYLDNGDEIVITGTWYFIIPDDETGDVDQAVVSLSKTQLKKSKQLMTKLRTLLLNGPNGKFNPPLFYSKVKVTSVPESNDQGNWMGWKFELNGNVFELKEGKEIYEMSKGLMEAVRSGKVKAATEAPSDDAGGGGGKDIDHDGAGGTAADKEIPF